MYVEMLNGKIAEMENETKKLQPEIKEKQSNLDKLRCELKDVETENKKYAHFSNKAKYREAYIVALFFCVIFFVFVLTYGFGGLIPLDNDDINFISVLLKDNGIAALIGLLVVGSPVYALILWPIVSLFKKIILIRKSKKAKETTEKTEARIKSIKNSISRTQSELDKINNKVKSNQDNINRIKKIIPPINDYETAMELSEQISDDISNISKVYHLLKSSSKKMKNESNTEFNDVYQNILQTFEKIKDNLLSIEDGDTLVAISTMLMPEDHVFALQLLQKSVDRNTEAGKEAIKIVLDQSEQHIYNSEYNTALEFLTPLKEAGNQEAKELWRKAMDLQHQEKIERERQIAEQKAREDEEMMRRVRERLNATPERTFTQGGPTGCGIGGSFCGCGSGR